MNVELDAALARGQQTIGAQLRGLWRGKRDIALASPETSRFQDAHNLYWTHDLSTMPPGQLVRDPAATPGGTGLADANDLILAGT